MAIPRCMNRVSGEPIGARSSLSKMADCGTIFSCPCAGESTCAEARIAATKMARKKGLERVISNLDSLDGATKSALNTLPGADDSDSIFYLRSAPIHRIKANQAILSTQHGRNGH